MTKRTGTFKNTDLSGKGFILKPTYKRGRVPHKLEDNDRVFDPTKESQTHAPMHVDKVRCKSAFNQIAHDKKATNIWVVIKRPQSDVYHVPAELGQFSEFIQKVANFEHNRTPGAFTRGATLYIRQGTGTDSPWHYDTRTEDTSTSWHHVCTNLHPTQHMVLNFTPEQRAAVKFDGTFQALYDLTDFKKIKDRQLSTLPVKSGDAYDITRHSSSCLHKGTASGDSRERTFVTVSYINFESDAEYDNYAGPLMERFSIVLSHPIDEAAERLAHYLAKQHSPQLV